jgi:hypothetical protein
MCLRVCRSGDQLFKELVKDGFHTNTFIPYTSIKEWVHDLSRVEGGMLPTILKSSPAMVNNAIQFLCQETSRCYHLPKLNSNRLWISGNHSMYAMHLDEFFAPGTIHLTEACYMYFDIDFKQISEEIDGLRGSFTEGNWVDIATPDFDSVFRMQFEKAIPNDPIELDYTLRFNLAMLGRCLYPVGTDQFQKMYVLTGLPGTGKSIIAKVIERMFMSNDVHTVSAQPQEVFALQTIYDKKLWQVKELDDKFFKRFHIGDICSMICGESVNVRRKHMTDLSIEQWTCQQLAIGNKMPSDTAETGWPRRLYLQHFNCVVKNPDITMEHRILKNIVRIMIKINRAYRSLLVFMEENCVKNLETIQPKIIGDNVDKYMAQSCLFLRFMGSPLVSHNVENTVPLSVVKTAFFGFCAKNNYPRPSWNETVYQVGFTKRGVRLGNTKVYFIIVVVLNLSDSLMWQQVRSEYPHASANKDRLVYNDYVVSGIDIDWSYLKESQSDEGTYNGPNDWQATAARIHEVFVKAPPNQPAINARKDQANTLTRTATLNRQANAIPLNIETVQNLVDSFSQILDEHGAPIITTMYIELYKKKVKAALCFLDNTGINGNLRVRLMEMWQILENN